MEPYLKIRIDKINKKMVGILVSAILSILMWCPAHGEVAETGSNRIPEEVCVAGLFEMPTSFDPQTAWDRFDDFVVAREGTKYRIVADLIHLEPKRFAFLERGNEDTLANASELVIDARKIIVDMNIILEDGALELHGKTVAFTSRGAVAIAGTPKNQNQRIEIITEHLDLTRAALKDPTNLIPVWTRDWKDHAWQGLGRHILVKAGRVSLPAGAGAETRKNLKDHPAKFIRNLTADRAKSSLEGWEKMYDVSIGSAAEYGNLEQRTLLWPDYTLDRLAAAHAYAPYDRGMNAYLLSKIEEFRPVFVALPDTAGLMRLEQLRQRILAGEDLSGRTAHDIPPNGVKDLVRKTRDNINRLLGGQARGIALWDETLRKSLFDPEMGKNALDELKKKAKEKSAEVKTLSGEMDKIFNDLALNSAKMTNLSHEIEGRRKFLKDELAKQVEKEKAAGNIEKVVEVIKVAAVVVATVYGDPGIVAGALKVSEGASKVGQIAAAHNRGQRIDAAMVAKTFREVEAEHATLSKKIEGFKLAWNGNPKAEAGSVAQLGLRQAGQQVLDHVRSGFNHDGSSFGSFMQAAETARGAMKEITANLPVRGAAVTLNQERIEADDAEFQKLIARFNSLSTEQANLVARQPDLLERKTMALAEEATILEDIHHLNRIQPDDPVARARLAQVALWHRKMAMNALRDNLVELLRSYAYHAGESPVMPDQQRENLARLSPRIPVFFSPENLEVWLKDDRERMLFNAETLVESVALKVENASMIVNSIVSEPFAAAADSPTSDQRDFLKMINTSITAQIVQQGHANLTGLAVPFWPAQESKHRPERYIRGVVSEVEFDTSLPRDAQIRFSVIHPGVGFFQTGNACAFVRIYRPEEGVGTMRWDYNFPASHGSTQAILEGLQGHVQEIAWAYNFPYRAPYLLEVKVLNPEQYQGFSPPKVTHLRIDFLKWTEP